MRLLLPRRRQGRVGDPSSIALVHSPHIRENPRPGAVNYVRAHAIRCRRDRAPRSGASGRVGGQVPHDRSGRRGAARVAGRVTLAPVGECRSAAARDADDRSSSPLRARAGGGVGARICRPSERPGFRAIRDRDRHGADACRGTKAGRAGQSG